MKVLDKVDGEAISVYCLVNEARSHTYVGASVDVVRRLRQHNGQLKGGAMFTSRPSLRPWTWLCVVQGFVDWQQALRFEWAWKHASPKSVSVRNVYKRTKTYKGKRPLVSKLSDADRIESWLERFQCPPHLLGHSATSKRVRALASLCMNPRNREKIDFEPLWIVW